MPTPERHELEVSRYKMLWSQYRGGQAMAEMVEVPFEGGTVLFAAAGSGGAQAFTGASITVRASESLEEVLDAVRKLAETMADKLSGLKFGTAEASFGIKFTGKGKFIVAEAGAEASLSIKLTFKGA
jgi:hypothetical protein